VEVAEGLLVLQLWTPLVEQHQLQELLIMEIGVIWEQVMYTMVKALRPFPLPEEELRV
jgi:hypothetical protein